MASLLSTPTLRIDPSPTPGNKVVTVSYIIQFDAFDKAADQPYLETVALVGDDTGVPGDPSSAGPDDQIALLSLGTIRPSMNQGPVADIFRSHVRTIPATTLDEDRPPVPNPDEIRAVVSLTPRPPVGVTLESNLVVLPSPKTKVPELEGKDLGDARKLILGAGLVRRERILGGTGDEFVVVAQRPLADTAVDLGSTVEIDIRRFGDPSPTA